MRYPLVIFDFDGTLADSFPFFVATHNLLARRHGFAEVAEAEVDGLRALPTRALLARSGLPAWCLPWVARDFIRAMAAAPSIPLFDGIPEVLRALHAAGITLALVSSNSRGNIRRILGPGLAGLFTAIEGGASLLGKQRRLARLIKRLGHDPGDTLYIGDQTADADAARAAGAHFGAVYWGYATREAWDRTSPDRSFAVVPDLLGLAAEPYALRPLSAADADAIAHLMSALANEDGGAHALRASPESLRADGPGGAGRFEGMLAIAGDRPVGYITWTWGYSIWSAGEICQVDDLYIAPQARGRGLGTRLLKAAREHAARRACVSLRWTVETGNHPAIALYRRLGAVVHGKGVCTWPIAIDPSGPR